jgi:hypothetical protein
MTVGIDNAHLDILRLNELFRLLQASYSGFNREVGARKRCALQRYNASIKPLACVGHALPISVRAISCCTRVPMTSEDEKPLQAAAGIVIFCPM